MIVRLRVAAAAVPLLVAGCALSGCGGSAGKSVDPATRVLVALPLSVDARGLQDVADRTADPGSPSFLEFRSLASLARTFGASSAVISHDERRLAEDGLRLALDPTHGAFWGVVTAAQAEEYFGVSLVEQGDAVYPEGTPHVPPGLRGVTGVVGLEASTRIPNRIVSGGSAKPSCPNGVATPSHVAQVFATPPARARAGTPPTVDVLAIRSLLPGPVFGNYNRCAGTKLEPGPIDTLRVPATPATRGGYEVALDTLVLRMLVPQARLRLINFDPSAALVFPLIESLATASTPDVLLLNDGSCETQATSAALKLGEWLLAAFTATGTSVVAAAGDTGSSGCHPASSAPAVEYPASSAFATSVGGADYNGGAAAPTGLRVWNEPDVAGGGGGVSAMIDAPPWQPPGHRRVPDVSAYATPGGVGTFVVCVSAGDCAWEDLGGTSLAAAVLSASLLSGENRRWGNLAAGLWRAGRSDPAVVDITDGSNETFSRRCCAAGPGYDTASGWGLVRPRGVQRELDRLRRRG